MSLFTPTTGNGTITFGVMMQNPLALTQPIRNLVERQSITTKFFRQHPGPIQGGAIQFNKVNLAEITVADDVEERSPGAEYRVTRPVDPDTRVAPVKDWGCSVLIYEEELRRGQQDYLQRVMQQATNTLVKQIDLAAMTALNVATTDEQIEGHDWSQLMFVGPADSLTPSAERPTADISFAQLAADLQQLDVAHDTLVVNPQEAHHLRTAYGPDLTGALASAGITDMTVNRLVEPGTAWTTQAGEAGYIGFEEAITVRAVEHANRRTLELVCYVVPAFAVSNPAATKLLTGLAG
ncbi:major capsid protein [Gordonia sp. MP11Mi]|uniref:Major capsid protein n=1 Tax=Gordonia sp. MP11Mi TaxID=3022769 RepID=A0AA97CWT0_9ACTN